MVSPRFRLSLILADIKKFSMNCQRSRLDITLLGFKAKLKCQMFSKKLRLDQTLLGFKARLKCQMFSHKSRLDQTPLGFKGKYKCQMCNQRSIKTSAFKANTTAT
jgi:hypothetical protein